MPAPERERRLHRLPHLLTPSGRAALRALASDRALLAFDFDGTLAPIADRPEEARMTARMRRLLAAVALLYPCAVISGRKRTDLVRRLGRLPMVSVTGSHGAEPGETPARPGLHVRRWAAHLRRHLRPLRGVLLELKPHGVAVHYRLADDKPAALDRILSVTATFHDARHLHGDHVLELLPVTAPTKGDALASLRRRLKPRATLYVGDDRTDEDAFVSGGPGELLPVRIGRDAATAALFRLDAQAEVEMLLRALIAARPPSRGPGTARPGRSLAR